VAWKLAIVGSRTVDPSVETIDVEVRRLLTLFEIPGSQTGISNRAQNQPHEIPGSHLEAEFDLKSAIVELVYPCASGGDAAGKRWADAHEIPVHREPITEEDIRLHGKYLGPRMRNRRVAERADIAIAFWDGRSGGTADFVCRMVARLKPVSVVPTRPTRRPRATRRNFE
jgi:hypothetical protein